jgi:hypothetical protein
MPTPPLKREENIVTNTNNETTATATTANDDFTFKMGKEFNNLAKNQTDENTEKKIKSFEKDFKAEQVSGCDTRCKETAIALANNYLNMNTIDIEKKSTEQLQKDMQKIFEAIPISVLKKNSELVFQMLIAVIIKCMQDYNNTEFTDINDLAVQHEIINQLVNALSTIHEYTQDGMVNIIARNVKRVTHTTTVKKTNYGKNINFDITPATNKKSYFGFLGRPIHKPVTTAGVVLGGFILNGPAIIGAAATAAYGVAVSVGSAVATGTAATASIVTSAGAFMQALNNQNSASETEDVKLSFLNTDLNTIDDFLKTYSHNHLKQIKDYLNSILTFSDKTMGEINDLLNSMEHPSIKKEEKMSKIIGIITILFHNFKYVEETHINNKIDEYNKSKPMTKTQLEVVANFINYKSVINRLIKPEIIIFRIMRELFINSLNDAKVTRYQRMTQRGVKIQEYVTSNSNSSISWANALFGTTDAITKKPAFKGGKRTKRKNATTKSRRRVVLKKKEVNAIAY